jgi:hypothetical protein
VAAENWTMGSKANPSRVSEIAVQGVRQNRRQIYAAPSQPRAIPGWRKFQSPASAHISAVGAPFSPLSTKQRTPTAQDGTWRPYGCLALTCLLVLRFRLATGARPKALNWQPDYQRRLPRHACVT